MAKVTDIHITYGAATVLKATTGDWVESSGVLTIDKATWTLADTAATTWVSPIGHTKAPKLTGKWKQAAPVIGKKPETFFPAEAKTMDVKKDLKLATYGGRNGKCTFKKA